MEPTTGNEEEGKNKKTEEKKFTRKKETQEEKLAKIDIKPSEQVRLNAVFQEFCDYEAEPSSDEDGNEDDEHRG